MSPAEAVVLRDPPQALARLDPQALLAAAIERGASVETIERFVTLAERVLAWQARDAFNEAKAEFTRRCPPIYKNEKARIATRTGPGYEYPFAPLEEVARAIDPLLGELGFSYRWRTARIEGSTLYLVCVLSHRAGHSEESGEVPMPIERSEGVGANSHQRVGIALAYARRYSLLAVTGRTAEKEDPDGAPPPGAGIDEGAGRVEDGPPPAEGAVIDEARATKMRAIASNHKWAAEALHDLLSQAGVLSGQIKDVPLAAYDALVQRLKEGPPR